MTDFTKFHGQKLMVFEGLGKNYGDRVGRESIDEAIRAIQGVEKCRKRGRNRPKTFLTRAHQQ